MNAEQLQLLNQIYHNPREGFLSAEKLYAKVKPLDSTITHSIIKSFLSNQEVQQIYSRRIVKHHYPLIAHVPMQRLQIDLLDLSNENPRLNSGYRYIFIAIDVFSRFVFAFPQKSKALSECITSLNALLHQISLLDFATSQIDSDNEASFTSNQFKTLCTDNDIIQNFAEPGDHARLGVIDRYCRTFRGYLSKYQTSSQSQKWLPILPDLIFNYNNTVHSSLKCTPTEALASGATGIHNYIQKQTIKASAAPYNKLFFLDGTKVRVLIPKTLFSKGSSTWSTQVYTITSFQDGLYYVDHLPEGKRKSELLQIEGEVMTAPQRIEPPDLEARKKTQAVERRVVRRVKKDGIDVNYKGIAEMSNDDKSQRALSRKQVVRPFMLSF